MSCIELIAIAAVGGLHILFGLAEMFFWPKMAAALMGIRDKRELKLTGTLAFNQGVYNLFIAAGLFWAVLFHDETVAMSFLVFVVVAGVVGAITASRNIFFLQALPALVALAILLF